LGRFISKDDASYGSNANLIDENLYAYCANNPMPNVDPTGNFYYNRDAAMNYAREWSGENRRNPLYHNYGNDGANDADTGTDCANFISQCLHAGGFPMTSAWHSYRSDPIFGILPDPLGILKYNLYYNWDVTASWREVNPLKDYLKNSGYCKANYTISSESDLLNLCKKQVLKYGDVMFLQPPDCTAPDHAVMISHVTLTEIEYTAHTHDRWNADLYKTFFYANAYNPKYHGECGKVLIYVLK
jgi:hypothetical protein